jgi:hypothetical protein
LLQCLNLNSTSLGDCGVKAILECLAERIPDDGSAEKHAGCLCESPLQILEIQRNEVTFGPKLIKSFLKVLRYGNLRLLDLSFNSLSDRSLSEIAFGLRG